MHNSQEQHLVWQFWCAGVAKYITPVVRSQNLSGVQSGRIIAVHKEVSVFKLIQR